MKKTLAIILTAIIVISALSLAATASARPFMNWKMFHEDEDDRPGNSHKFATQQSFVRVAGNITKWGTADVKGGIEAQSRTLIINNTSTRAGSSATAVWTANQSRPISGMKAKENFTYTFYSAKLVDPSMALLNMTGYSYFLNGTWNVFKITYNFTIVTDSTGNLTGFSKNESAVALVMNAYGELKVVSGGNSFTLNITGIDSLTGSVLMQRIATKMFNPFIVHNRESSNKVTKADVSTVIQSFGSVPGWGKYDQRMDFNFNQKIDITDLTTVAANMNA